MQRKKRAWTRCDVLKPSDFSDNNYEELWKLFYENIGIKERKNEKCRNNFMPKKYWKYIL